MTSALLPPETKFQFSGHETFPLRQLWLPKYAQLLNDLKKEGKAELPPIENCMVRLGVGKNMVAAMRFWAEASGMVEENSLKLTQIGNLIFGDGNLSGLDEYCEHPATHWLVHWRIAATPSSFTPDWFLFNCLNGPIVERESFFKSLKDFVSAQYLKVSDTSLKRAIEVCLRSYLPRLSGKGHLEDFIEPLLGGLDLLTPKSHDSFEFHRSSHPTLPDAFFAFCLMEYWDRLPNVTSTLDFNRIAYDFGSPGRVFKLDAKSIDKRLNQLEAITDEALVWTEQAGLRQVIRRNDALTEPDQFCRRMLNKAYAN